MMDLKAVVPYAEFIFYFHEAVLKHCHLVGEKEGLRFPLAQYLGWEVWMQFPPLLAEPF